MHLTAEEGTVMNRNVETNSILQELNRIRGTESRRGIKVPMPTFIYVQRYGRKAQDQVQEILSLVGKREWFLFKTQDSFPEVGLRRNFVTEIAKHAGTGKEFEGCVFIELSKDTLLTEEFAEFLEFLKKRENKLYYVFTTKKSKDAVSIQKCIEQYFFVRMVWAESYCVEEQLTMVEAVCEEYGFHIDPKAKTLLANGLKSKEWREDDCVDYRLRNEVCAIIYEAVLGRQTDNCGFSPEMAWKLLENLQKGNAEEITFGFNKREFEVV